MRSVEDLLSLAAYCRDRVNPQLFVYVSIPIYFKNLNIYLVNYELSLLNYKNLYARHCKSFFYTEKIPRD